MLTLPLGTTIRQVLFLGAHSDDIEIGCGGTLAVLARSRPDVRVHAVVFSGHGVRAQETRAAIGRLAPACELEVHEFRDGFFPTEWSVIKERFEALKREHKPDLIFTHYQHDRHQDHRVVNELTWNTFRNHTVLEYEIPKYDGDLGQPAVFLPLSAEIVEHKVATLLECFVSQNTKRWFTADLFKSLLRLRGMECNSDSGFAEAFYVRKMRIEW